MFWWLNLGEEKRKDVTRAGKREIREK